MPPGTGGRSALRRASLAGASIPSRRRASAMRAHSASVSARVSGQSYMGRAAIRKLISALSGLWDPEGKLFLRRLGRNRHGTVPRQRAAAGARTEGAPRVRLAVKDRMRHRLLGAEGKGLQQREIVRVGVAAIHAQPFLAPFAIERRQLVPGYGGQLVMDEMQIVVEEQEGKRRPLHDDGAPVRPLRPLMLREGAHGNQRLAEPG